MRRRFAQFYRSIISLLHRRRLALIVLFICVTGAILNWHVRRQALLEVESARSRLEKSAFVPFEKEITAASVWQGIKFIQSIRNVRDVAIFDGSYFAATDGGLVEYDPEGKLSRRYSVLDGLPESDLTCLSIFNERLIIGTRSHGLVVFNTSRGNRGNLGNRFESYRWLDRDAQGVAALLENRGRLLIGTFAGGLLEFDGVNFKERTAGEERKRLLQISCLAADESRIYAGAFADGLWINEAGRWWHFTTSDGLPSNRVVGIVTDDDFIFVATDFGLASASISQLIENAGSSSPAKFQTLITLPSLTSIAVDRDAILLSKDNGELYRLVKNSRSSSNLQIIPLSWNRPEYLSSCRLKQLTQLIGQEKGESPWLLSSSGLWRATRQVERNSGRIVLSQFGDEQDPAYLPGYPSSNIITSLAVDDRGRLWAGSFRDGIGIFTPEGRKISHLISESIREINALVWDQEAKRMSSATSQGLVLFDHALGPKRISKVDGLLSNSISHLALTSANNAAIPATRARLILATNRGLSLGEGNQWKALTNVNGLPGPGVYTVAQHRESIYAGTLNGLAQINGGQVTRVFKDSNSNLSHNWVTALCAIGPKLFVGTYGGGVFELTPAGELAGFVSEIGRQMVNPNAMVSDGERVYVGTLDGAWVLDLRSQKWTRLKTELPSTMVMSIATDDEHVYFGTSSGIARVEKEYFRTVKE
jgi:ligand-binding sensor domain-containing protein